MLKSGEFCRVMSTLHVGRTLWDNGLCWEHGGKH